MLSIGCWKCRRFYGGEGSAGPIDPEVGYVRDSFVGMAQVLDLMASTGFSVSQLVNQLPKSVMIKDKIELADLTGTGPCKLRQKLGDAKSMIKMDCDSIAGSVASYERSNTEPIVRIIVEALPPPLPMIFVRELNRSSLASGLSIAKP